MQNISNQEEQNREAAKVTGNQFRALGIYSNNCYENTNMYIEYIQSLRVREVNKIDLIRVKNLLINSWNTEKIIRLTGETFTNDSDGFITQWVFPQAYYSAFTSTLASFKVVGHSEESHTAVRAKVADLASRNKYPKDLCVWSDGSIKNTVVNGINCDKAGFQSLKFLYDDINDRNCHIHSFMKSTRHHFLHEKRQDKDFKKIFKTKKGKLKENLTQDDWIKVSESIKKTSWLCLLYRKRIKANYQDIDTFLNFGSELPLLLESIISFVNLINFVNEINVYHSVKEIDNWNNGKFKFVEERLDKIHKLYNIT